MTGRRFFFGPFGLPGLGRGARSPRPSSTSSCSSKMAFNVRQIILISSGGPYLMSSVLIPSKPVALLFLMCEMVSKISSSVIGESKGLGSPICR